jgi:hypothetical protein
MTESTYTTEEVIIERELNKLYGMAIARAKNKAFLEEAKSSFDSLKAHLYRQWREALKECQQ